MLGYRGTARFVGFWWDSELDDVSWDDGIDSEDATGQWEEWSAYLAQIGPYLRVNLGRTDEEATHLVIFDRAEKYALVAWMDEGLAFLKNQPVA